MGPSLCLPACAFHVTSSGNARAVAILPTLPAPRGLSASCVLSSLRASALGSAKTDPMSRTWVDPQEAGVGPQALEGSRGGAAPVASRPPLLGTRGGHSFQLTRLKYDLFFIYLLSILSFFSCFSLTFVSLSSFISVFDLFY